jgi:hypothetical protein
MNNPSLSSQASVRPELVRRLCARLAGEMAAVVLPSAWDAPPPAAVVADRHFMRTAFAYESGAATAADVTAAARRLREAWLGTNRTRIHAEN